MASNDQGILMYESTLDGEAQQQLRQIGWADVLIGIPTHRNARTLDEVLTALVQGIATYLPDRRIVLMNADGGSSDNTVNLVADCAAPSNVIKLLTTYQGQTGKGVAIRSLFEAAAKLNVKACVVFEAQAPGITPEWLPTLAGPVLHGDDATLACYHRTAYSASLTDNLAYPFTRVFFNTDLREPLASEFAISGSLAAELAACDVWETNIARYGVNAWLATYVILHNHVVSQVDLGYRGEVSGEPGVLQDPRIMHPCMALFRLLSAERPRWEAGAPPVHVPLKGGYGEDHVIDGVDCTPELLMGMREGVQRYAEQIGAVLSPSRQHALRELLQQPDESFRFPVSLWAKIVLDFALSYNYGEDDPDRVIEALLPLYFGRTVSYMRESAGLTPAQREPLVRNIVAAYQQARTAFLQAWRKATQWDDVDDRFW